MDHIELFNKMIEYYEGNPKRIQHFTKVFEYCRLIGTMENIPEKEQFALETTALVHDIGIKKAEDILLQYPNLKTDYNMEELNYKYTQLKN